jgi:hypothetical protein
MRAIRLLATVREESQTVLALNPASVEGLILAGSLTGELPAILGGSDARAEALLTRALELDPHHTAGRVSWRACTWRRIAGATPGASCSVVDEPRPTDRPRWAMSDRPSARALLADLYARGRLAPLPEAP